MYPPDQQSYFVFLYPPFAALLIAPFCLFGRAVMIALLVAVSLASWWAAAALSDRLAGWPQPKPWWLVALPSALALPFIVDTIHLGQPNLALLAIMLAGLALLQRDRQAAAGALFALAAAIKAFPVMALPYLLWRRRWRAAASMVACVVVFLLVAPAPLRGFYRNARELTAWFDGMVLSASEEGFGKRAEENWSWKNNSIVAVTHRLSRPVNAVQNNPAAKPLFVNVLNLSYRQANLVLLAICGLIGAGFCLVLPAERRRSPRSDAAEFALLLCLMTIASPLARSYYFVWLMFPMTTLAQRAALEGSARERRIAAGALAIAAALFAIGPLFWPRHWVEAVGSWLWATAVVAAALAWALRREAAADQGRRPERALPPAAVAGTSRPPPPEDGRLAP